MCSSTVDDGLHAGMKYYDLLSTSCLHAYFVVGHELSRYPFATMDDHP